jgi:GrpB-like predicted nucleotidyltransferase (UPF0157 family)
MKRFILRNINLNGFRQYADEKKQLLDVLGDIVVGIEHIGSTFISEIWAKPIVDIMIGVQSLPLEKFYIDKVIKLGYEYLGKQGLVEGFTYVRDFQRDIMFI